MEFGHGGRNRPHVRVSEIPKRVRMVQVHGGAISGLCPIELQVDVLRTLSGERLGPPAGEAVELDELAVDEAPASERERVHERSPDTECLPFGVVERPVELLVPHEHVSMNLVA